MLSFSQSKHPSDPFFFANKNPSLSSLLTTSEYGNAPSESLNLFAPTSKEIYGSSKHKVINNDESPQLKIEDQQTLLV